MQGEASTRLGFTDYFRVELAWAKLLGAVLLLAPVPARLKEWAYAAFAITLGSALIAHLSIGEGPRRRGAGRRAPGVLWGLSYFCGVASRARASAGPLEDEQRVANQDPKNPAQMKASTGSPLTDVSAEYRFHVDDGRSVQSFEMSHLQSSTVDCRNDHVMQTDRIRTVGGSRAEYALLLSGAVTSRMHCEHVPTSAIEPGDKNQFIARSDALQPFEDFRFEHQPRCRRAFVGLSGGRFWLCQRRFHLTDRRHRETRHDASLGCSRCRSHQVPASTILVVQRFRLFAQSQVALAFDQRGARLASR